jgi:putative tricarboxylic transport membrane protein
VEQAKIIIPYCLMIAVYLFLMGKIGYIASTVVFMISSLLYLKLKNKILMIVLSVVLTIILYFVFTNFLTVILPRGTWFNIAF